MGLEAIALLLAPALLQGAGSFFDDSGEQNLEEQKRQFDLSHGLQKEQSGLQAGSFLSRLLDQRQSMQDKYGRGAGSAAALGGGQ